MSELPELQSSEPSCVALTGGVGGAKLCLGLSRLIAGPELTMIANCGDDFEHFGLHISPDIDTVMYTLAGIANSEYGWGRADETWSFMTAMEQLGAETWFRIGDKDLAVNIERTRRLQLGQTLSRITAELCSALGLQTRLLPASDDYLRTMLETDIGLLDFQTYLVKERAEPVVSNIIFDGHDKARAAPGVVEALSSPQLKSVIICPSNPFVSIDPILAASEIADALKSCNAPVIAVSPIIGGQALKGPAAKMFREFGIKPSALEIARHYGSIIDGMVLDTRDAEISPDIAGLGLQTRITNTIMNDIESKVNLATAVLDLAERCRTSGPVDTLLSGEVSTCG